MAPSQLPSFRIYIRKRLVGDQKVRHKKGAGGQKLEISTFPYRYGERGKKCLECVFSQAGHDDDELLGAALGKKENNPDAKRRRKNAHMCA